MNDGKKKTFSLLWINFKILSCKSKFQIDFFLSVSAFEAYFLQCNICFKYVSSIFYKKKVRFYLLCFFSIYNDLYVITSHKSIPLNFLMKNHFWTSFWLVKFKSTCPLLLLFQFFSEFFFNLIQIQWKALGFKMKFKYKLNLLSCVFVKNYLFLNLIFFHNFFLHKIPFIHPNLKLERP